MSVEISFGKYVPVRLSPDMICVFPKGIQFTQELQAQPKSTHGSDSTCIGETPGFAGKQDASNRIRGFQPSVSGSLWVSLCFHLLCKEEEYRLHDTGVRRAL